MRRSVAGRRGLLPSGRPRRCDERVEELARGAEVTHAGLHEMRTHADRPAVGVENAGLQARGRGDGKLGALAVRPSDGQRPKTRLEPGSRRAVVLQPQRLPVNVVADVRHKCLRFRGVRVHVWAGASTRAHAGAGEHVAQERVLGRRPRLLPRTAARPALLGIRRPARRDGDVLHVLAGEDNHHLRPVAEQRVHGSGPPVPLDGRWHRSGAKQNKMAEDASGENVPL
mmetsp:Transcript_47299/g.145904  ORF Transcript_47299/g.145904 Transcript_47299/m.145904 type:complete len:227 (-) Transcript_47299:56-736(-)